MIKPAGVKIYFQPMESAQDCGRVRIIQPNGKTNWMGNFPLVLQHYSSWMDECCFAKEGMTQKQVIKAMIRYDKYMGHPPAELIGEL